MNYRKKRIIKLLLCLSLLVPLIGFSENAKEDIISVEFQCLGLGEQFRRMNFYYKDGEEVKSIVMNDLARTKSYEYTGLKNLVFYSDIETQKAVTSVTLSIAKKKPLLLFLPNEKQESKRLYRIVEIEDSLLTFGAGTYFFYNLSSRDLAWKVGKEMFKIKSGTREYRTINIEGEHVPVIGVDISIDGQNRRVYRSGFKNYPNVRRIIFIRDTVVGEAGKIRLQVIEDFTK
jgi:hypothetical protein